MIITIGLTSEGNIWQTKEDVYESFQKTPPLQEIKEYLMKYFLDRRDHTRGKRFIPYHDIIFILDSSKFLSEENFNLSVITAQNLVTRFDPETQFASIIFGTNATISFNFHFARVAIECFGKVGYQGGKRNTFYALQAAQNMLLLNHNSGVRDGSRKKVLLVTTGPCERTLTETIKLQRLIWVAMQIKNLGAEVFVVAVGNRIPRIEELLLIPSSTDVHFYRVANMTAFKSLVDEIPIHIVYQDDY